jgi:hypothetical protein
MSRSRVITIGILFGLVVVVVVAIIAFSPEKREMVLDAPDWQTSTVPENVADPDSSKVVDVKDLPLESIDGWQRYVNEELGFSANYPEGWFVRDYWKDPRPKPSLASTVGFDPWERYHGGSEWRVTCHENTKGNIQDQVELLISQEIRNYDPSMITREESEVDGYQAIKISTVDESRNITWISVYIIHNNYVYTIVTSDYSQVVIDEIEVDPYGEGGTALRDRSILFKEISEKGYPDMFLGSFRIL